MEVAVCKPPERLQEGIRIMSMTDTILNEFSETVCIMDKRTVPDGLGGIISNYINGAEFMAAIVPDVSTTAQIAQAQSEIKRYRITTPDTITLTEGDYIKRLTNGETYKILHTNTDKLAPDSSAISGIRSTTMERVKLPT